MTKAELVEEVSRVSDLTKKHSEVIVDTVFESIIDALKRGEKIELRGFGSFRLRKREPRKGRNPKTGDKVDVPPKRVPYFKPGKELKDLINKETGEPVDGAARASFQRIQPELVPHGADLVSLETCLRDAIGRAAGCVFCIAKTIGDGRQLIVHEGQLAYVILNNFPYNSGHLMVVPHRHVAIWRCSKTRSSPRWRS